jgi:hypothetical protein
MSVRYAASLVYVASLNLEERLVGSLVKCCKVSLPSAVGGENLVDSGWIAVVGVAVGGSLTAAVTLLQARYNAKSAKEDREYKEITERRADLLKIYTRYQLAADRLENAIRDLAEVRHAISEGDIKAANRVGSADSFLEAFEAAQREYDEVCEILKLVAPRKITEVALEQRKLWNRFAREALDDSYDHNVNYESIVEASQPVLSAMREDLESPE